jgi:hypothetical protein
MCRRKSYSHVDNPSRFAYLRYIGGLIRKAGRGVFSCHGHEVGRSLRYCPIILSTGDFETVVSYNCSRTFHFGLPRSRLVLGCIQKSIEESTPSSPDSSTCLRANRLSLEVSPKGALVQDAMVARTERSNVTKQNRDAPIV